MNDEASNFAHAKHLKFEGLVRVGLSALSFDKHRALSSKNVKRLQKIYRIEGCQRLDDSNFVDALVTKEQLTQVSHIQPLAFQQHPPKEWNACPIINIKSLSCLTGLHRVEAAKEFLDANDQWWVARIYTNDLPNAPRERLIEEYSNEGAPTDGEIFYKIRQYNKDNDKPNELKWWARLTETKRKDLRQLLKDQRYVDVFDSMLQWPGLWTPIKLGCLHRQLAMRCDEELLSYLGQITQTWRNITLNLSGKDIVDTSSVARLQTLAPYHSSADHEEVSDLIATKAIFTKVTFQGDREILEKNIHSIKMTIPSLYTFFEDMKYLEPCAKVLRALLPPKTKQSTYRGLMSSYIQPRDVLVEHSHNDLRVHNPEQPMPHLAYQQLWLFALRSFPLLTNFTTRKAFDKDKPVAIEPSPTVWQEFGVFARRLGFLSSFASELHTQDSTQLIVSQFLDRYAEGSSGNESAANKIISVLKTIHGQREQCQLADFFGKQRMTATERCGRPFEDDHRKDKTCLYLPQLYRDPGRGTNVTTFYRKWCMFRMFMGIETLASFDGDTRVEDDGTRMDLTPNQTEPSRMAGPAKSCSASDCALNQAIEGLETRLRALDREKVELHQRCVSRENTISKLEKQLQQTSAKNEHTSTELHKKLETLVQAKATLEHDLEVMKSTVEQADDGKIAALAREVQKLQCSKFERDKQIADLKLKVDEQSQTDRKRQTRISDLEKLAKLRESEIETLKSTIRAQSGNDGRSQSDKNTQDGNEELQQTRDAINHLKSQLQTSQFSIGECQRVARENHDTYQEAQDTLSRTLLELRRDNDNLKSKVQDEQQKRAEAEARESAETRQAVADDQEALSRTRKEYEQRMSKAREEYEQAIAKTRDECMAQARDECEQTIIKRREVWIAEAQAEHENMIAKARDEYMAQAREEHEQRMAKTREALIAEAQVRHEQSMAQAREEHEQMMAKSREALTAEAREEHEQMMVKTREALMAEAQAGHEKSMAQVREDHEQTIAKAREERKQVEAAHQEIVSGHESKTRNLDTKIIELSQAGTQLQQQLVSEQQGAKDATDKAMALQQKFEVAKEQHKNVITDFELKIGNLKAELSGTRQRIEEQTSNRQRTLKAPNAEIFELLSEANDQSSPQQDDIRLCTLMRFGSEMAFFQNRFSVNSALQMIKHLKLSSDSDRWEYAGNLFKKLPASTCKDEGCLAQAWIQNKRLIRWLHEDKDLVDAWLKDIRTGGMSLRPIAKLGKRREPNQVYGDSVYGSTSKKRLA